MIKKIFSPSRANESLTRIVQFSFDTEMIIQLYPIITPYKHEIYFTSWLSNRDKPDNRIFDLCTAGELKFLTSDHARDDSTVKAWKWNILFTVYARIILLEYVDNGLFYLRDDKRILRKKKLKKKKERKNQNKKFKYYEKNFNDRKSIFINHILLKKKIKENKKKQQIDKKIFVKLLKFIKYSIKYLFIVV